VTLGSPIQNEITRVLLAHPDITDAALITEEGTEGQNFQIAYVVVDSERVHAGKSRLYAAERNRRILQWRKTFDNAYRRAAEDFRPSFVGWTSNFTNKPIPEQEMIEWLDCTVNRIQALKAKRILEVGCGVGLLVERLAPGCPSYCGTDFSPVAVGRLREFIAARRDLRHVELLEREATDFSGLASNSFDAVILNSVVQYFPSIEYLQDVLQQAARVVAPGGHIFVGDVRHLGLLRTFHGAVQLAKAPIQARAGWLKRRIDLAIQQERELVIDPLFFFGLSRSIRSLTGVDVLLKRGSNSELTRYRYDVLLQVDGTSPSFSGKAVEMQGDSAAPEDVLSHLRRAQIPAVRVLNIPNRRVAADLAAVRSLWSANERQLIKDIPRQSAHGAADGGDPEAFWRTGDGSDYSVIVGCSPHSTEGRFDVALADRRHSPVGPSLHREGTDLSKVDGRPVATDPMAAAFMHQLGLELGDVLRSQFPEAQQPAAVIALNKIPLGDTTDESSLVPRMAPQDGRELDHAQYIAGGSR
jgi:SAM-dependent methyltransferase